MNKTVIILSGVSGSGKSFTADLLKEKFSGETVICCADDYFVDKDGNYNFDASKLGKAHEQCRAKFMVALYDKDVENVIIANTNTSRKEFKFYQNQAEVFGYNCVRWVVDNIHGNEDLHGVPKETKENQLNRLKNSIK